SRIRGAAAPVADGADTDRWGTARVCHPQRHAGGSGWSGIAVVACGGADLDRWAFRCGVGHACRSGIFLSAVPSFPTQGSARMLNLAEYRRKATSLADYLPWACLVAPGVVLNKDGSFQRTARYRGPDLDSATEAELVSVTARVNNVLKRFG